MRYGHVQIFHQSISMNVGTCSRLQLAAVTTGQTERVMRCVLQPFRHGTICYLEQTLYHTLHLILYFKLHSENIADPTFLCCIACLMATDRDSGALNSAVVKASPSPALLSHLTFGAIRYEPIDFDIGPGGRRSPRHAHSVAAAADESEDGDAARDAEKAATNSSAGCLPAYHGSGRRRIRVGAVRPSCMWVLTDRMDPGLCR